MNLKTKPSKISNKVHNYDSQRLLQNPTETIDNQDLIPNQNDSQSEADSSNLE